MKKGKYLFLLAAVLSLLLIFVACEGETETEAQSDTDTATETVTEADTATETKAETQEETETETETEPEPHEIHNYFDILQQKVEMPLTDVSRIDGDIMEVDSYHHLAVISKKDLDTMNNVVQTIDVIDILSGETLMTKSVSNPLGAPTEEVTTLRIEIVYPVIKVVRQYYVEERAGEGFETEYSVEYYLAKKDSEMLYSTDTTDNFEIEEFENGLVRVQMEREVKWVDKNLDVIRTVKTIASTGYDVDRFDCEYKGYMYTSTPTSLMIFNRSGICSAVYTAGENSFINYFVLNNGNALVQEITEVDAFQSCDFVLEGSRYTLKSSIVNFVNGEITEIELGFLVDSLETKYYQRAGEYDTLVLNKGYENYAFVYNVANGSIAKHADLVVLSNSLEVLYTFSNDAEGVDLADGMWIVNDDYYITPVNDYGFTKGWGIFDLYGEKISYVSYMADLLDYGYIITNNGIYNYEMKLVIDLLKEGYTIKTSAIDGSTYFAKMNYQTGGEESYVFVGDTGEMKMIADGIDVKLDTVTTEFYVLYDVEKDVYVAYNVASDEELIVSHEKLSIYTVNEDLCLIVTNLDGEPIVYIVK